MRPRMFPMYIPPDPRRLGPRSAQAAGKFAERLQWLAPCCSLAGRTPYYAGAMKTVAFLLLSILLSLGASAQVATTKPADPLLDGFIHPPQIARPLVWWHWMNGNISKEGIKLDLEWMHRVGIAGFQNFDAALTTPQVVDHRIAYMTPEWKDAFKYATTLADHFGMEEGIAGSPGWSESGGPWVPGPEAMKKYVWSETIVEGGKLFTGTLTQPPTVTGNFQNTPAVNPAIAEPEFYADSAVIAYRAPASELPLPQPIITSSSGAIDAYVLADDNTATSVTIKAGADTRPLIQAAFPQSVTIRSVTASIGRGDGVSLESSNDGINFHSIIPIPMAGALEQTLSFAPVAARYFRLQFALRTPSPDNITVNEFALHSGARVNRFEDKAGFQPIPDLYGFATPEVATADSIQHSDVIDLNSRGSFAISHVFSAHCLHVTVTGR
jgi:hypothetical protein